MSPMRIVEIISPSELSFRIENRGAHHGQSDLTLIAYRNGIEVGHIDYSVYQGEPSVQMIRTNFGHLRQGVATEMVHKLQSEFPDTEINMGGSTDDGTKLLASIPKKIIHNPEYQAAADRLEQVKAKLAQYAAMADAFHENPTDAGRQELHRATADWNDLNSEEWELEQALYHMQPNKRLFVR